MQAKYLEVSGRTFYAFEEPDFVGPMPIARPELKALATVEKYNEGNIEAKFWKRQFGPITTLRQRKFDWAFGVFLPAICFFFDPFVFRRWYSDNGMLAAYQTFAYLLSGTAIMGLAAWLLWGEKLKSLNAPLAGLFFAAGLIAGLIGIALFPISVIGTVFVIGLLGFTPILTSIVFLRNAVRASRASSFELDTTTLGYVVSLSAITCLVVPWVVNRMLATTANRGIDLFP